MKKELNRKLQLMKVIAIFNIILGTVLLLYMITVEDVPGALPLLLIFSGIVISLLRRYQSKKHFL